MVEALVAMAGSALVQAMVSDGWEGVRRKVARLFGRGGPDLAIERRLDAARQQLTAAASADIESLQARLAVQWETRFADLLADFPDAEAELNALVQELSARLPVQVSDHSAAAGRDVNISADRGSVAAAVIHGDVAAGPTPPGPVAS